MKTRPPPKNRTSPSPFLLLLATLWKITLNRINEGRAHHAYLLLTVHIYVVRLPRVRCRRIVLRKI